MGLVPRSKRNDLLKPYSTEPYSTEGYWWRGVSNFGDAMAPLLLAYHADVKVTWADPQEAHVVSSGSVLEHLPDSWDGYVVGAGKLHENSDVQLVGSVRARRIMAIRGPLSAKGIPGDYALGDAGLLADELIELPPKLHDLGIVAHWTDKELPQRPEFQQYNPVIIDPRGEPLDVIRQIAECRKIVSSSLHGIIVADTFAIPRRLEYAKHMDRPSEGGDFKFRDYHLSIKTPYLYGKTIMASRYGVDDRRFEIHDAFREFAARIRTGL